MTPKNNDAKTRSSAHTDVDDSQVKHTEAYSKQLHGPHLEHRQANFLSKVIEAIPRLFQALEEGNVRAEWILGLRQVRRRQARLKLVAELVDAGDNPLKTHGARNQSKREPTHSTPDISSNSAHDPADDPAHDPADCEESQPTERS